MGGQKHSKNADGYFSSLRESYLFNLELDCTVCISYVLLLRRIAVHILYHMQRHLGGTAHTVKRDELPGNQQQSYDIVGLNPHACNWLYGECMVGPFQDAH